MTYYVDLFGFHVVKNILRKHKSASKLCKAGYVITVANTLKGAEANLYTWNISDRKEKYTDLLSHPLE